MECFVVEKMARAGVVVVFSNVADVGWGVDEVAGDPLVGSVTGLGERVTTNIVAGGGECVTTEKVAGAGGRVTGEREAWVGVELLLR